MSPASVKLFFKYINGHVPLFSRSSLMHAYTCRIEITTHTSIYIYIYRYIYIYSLCSTTSVWCFERISISFDVNWIKWQSVKKKQKLMHKECHLARAMYTRISPSYIFHLDGPHITSGHYLWKKPWMKHERLRWRVYLLVFFTYLSTSGVA